MSVASVLERIDKNFDHFVSRLDELSRIPGISAEPAPSAALTASAEKVTIAPATFFHSFGTSRNGKEDAAGAAAFFLPRFTFCELGVNRLVKLQK